MVKKTHGYFNDAYARKMRKNCPDLDDWLLVTLTAQLCNHFKICNLPRDIMKESKWSVQKQYNKMSKKVNYKSVLARFSSADSV